MKTKTKKKLSVGIIGASGYTGEELVRLLSAHPFVELRGITSREFAGKSVSSVFPRFSTSNLVFQQPDVQAMKHLDIVFMCLPHGTAFEYIVPLLESGVKIIDLSADFRLHNPEDYREYYHLEHPDPGLLQTSVYGLPELHRNTIREAALIACPGCYPTSAILPMYPLFHSGMVVEDIIICSASGVTGAGRKVHASYLFAECNESMRCYSTTHHRHIPEIKQELSSVSENPFHVHFTAHLVPLNRGMSTTIFLQEKEPSQDSRKVLEAFYKNESFVRILPEGQFPDTKNVTYTNRCDIAIHQEKTTGKIILHSVIDNLMKGAAGQAIQCMNCASGFEEDIGLRCT